MAPTRLKLSAQTLQKHIQPLSMRLYRVVESQEEVATTVITASKQDQSLLEDLLESSKPSLEPPLSQRHYLISTPFRYPPLRHGSRFGSIIEAGLFYGSTTMTTALTEIAYYRFRFLADVEDAKSITRYKPQSNHCGFYVNTHSLQGLSLLEKPFQKLNLSAVDSYSNSQAMGTKMRQFGVELFKFQSARDVGGINGGCFTHQVIKSKRPCATEYWQCLMLEDRVIFNKTLTKENLEFTQNDFQVNGTFPIIN